MSYVLSVHRTEEALNENDHPAVWAELGKVNRLTELRSDAIEIFVHLPVDARDQFIEGYFRQTNPDEWSRSLPSSSVRSMTPTPASSSRKNASSCRPRR